MQSEREDYTCKGYMDTVQRKKRVISRGVQTGDHFLSTHAPGKVISRAVQTTDSSFSSHQDTGNDNFKNNQTQVESSKTNLRTFGSHQVNEQQTKVTISTGSYQRKNKAVSKWAGRMTFRQLLSEVINSKENTIAWMIENRLLMSAMACDVCNSPMKLLDATNCSDTKRWRCHKNNHDKSKSIRECSWFKEANLTLEEIIEFIYWWSTGKP